MAVSLLKLRHDKGLNVRVAAKEIGITVPTLLDAENDVTNPAITTKHKIASFYGVQVTDVWPIPEREEAA